MDIRLIGEAGAGPARPAGLATLLPPRPPPVPTNHPQPGTVFMSRRKLIVKGRGPDGRTTFSLEAYQGKVWITSYDCPFICEAILDPTQADSLIDLINQTAKEARGYRR